MTKVAFLSDRAYEKFADQNPVIGRLAERHPELLFAAVHEQAGGYLAVFAGRSLKLPAGTKIRLWNGSEITA